LLKILYWIIQDLTPKGISKHLQLSPCHRHLSLPYLIFHAHLAVDFYQVTLETCRDHEEKNHFFSSQNFLNHVTLEMRLQLLSLAFLLDFAAMEKCQRPFQ